jgi:hypothetical protein
MAATRPRYTLEIEAPANGRVGRATVRVLDEEGKTVHTDRGDLMTATERRKLAKRMAEQLGIDEAELLKQLEAVWNQTLDEHCVPPKQGAAPPDATPEADGRPVITITTEEHTVNEQATRALGNDRTIYQRASLLVRVVRDDSPAGKGIRRPLAPRIEALPPPLVRERLAASARWRSVRQTEGQPVMAPAHPPGWCVAAVHARANWPGVRHLEAVVDYPVLRPDGTLLLRPGYDPDTGLLLEMGAVFPELPECPTRGAAITAREILLEAVQDFPFGHPTHRATWLAALLTLLGRFAFSGPAPLFLADSNVRGAGKGLLLSIISQICTGHPFTVAAYTQDEDELRKRITSLVMAGDRLVLLDNLEGKFGNAVLDAALTATAWKDRVLGGNRQVEAPLCMTWYATGNNVVVATDTARRVGLIRLESPEERPELRGDFRHPNLLAWVGENRSRLLAAALTILRAYCAAGRPDMGLRPWGSFEGWSALVRSAVVWCDLPDPGETRLCLQNHADPTAEFMGTILACLEQMDPQRQGLTAAEIIHRAFPRDQAVAGPAHLVELRAAIEGLIGRGDAQRLGYKLRAFRRRVFQGRFLDRAGTEHQAARWVVYPASAFRTGGEDGEDGEHV